jgi:hypothetical protein
VLCSGRSQGGRSSRHARRAADGSGGESDGDGSGTQRPQRGVWGNGNARFESADPTSFPDQNRQSSRFISLDRFSELKD